MQQDLGEIKKVFDKHGYSINSILTDILKKFNFKSICWQSGAKKGDGYSITEILVLMLMMPLMLVKSVHALYKSQYKENVSMQKDVFYRLKNNEKMPWRRLLYGVAKKFRLLVNPDKKIADNSSFIVDDTIDIRVGYKIENISMVHDHTGNKKGAKLGFKDLFLGYFDGKSFNPLDFSIHTEKLLNRKKRKKQFEKNCAKNSNGYKRRKECKVNKINNALKMIKRAVKNGFMAKYVLADSWFSSKKFIRTIRSIKNGAMHVVCGVRKDKRKYTYKGEKVNAKQLLKILKKESKPKRCRKWNTRYYEVVVEYEGIGTVKLYLCRFPYQKKWRLYLSTDTKLTFIKMMEIYSIRWSIEIFFKEAKQFLRLGKCQSRDFDAQIASITISCILYIFLSYIRRINDYESLGGLFEAISDDLNEKNLAQRLWQLFDDLLQVAISVIAESGVVDITLFKKSPEYQYIKSTFEESFLSNQIFSFNKSA
jgi:hypothetical protein